MGGLLDFGAKVKAPRPRMAQAKKELSGIEYCDDAYACAEGTDAMVIVKEWRPFRALDVERIKATMVAPVIIDFRNIYRPEDMSKLGFKYESIGRPT
jgi:UDPglucose 6-dehydrogenase